MCFVMQSCFENIDNTPEEPEVIIETPSITINTEVIGKVFDENENTFSGYSLLVGDQTELVEKDFFYFSIENVEKRGETFFLQVDGQQRGIKTESLIENDINYFEIYAHPEINRHKLNTISEPITSNSRVTIDVNAVINSPNTSEEDEVLFVQIDEKIKMTEVGFDEFGDVLSVETLGGFYYSVVDQSGSIIEIPEENLAEISFNGIPAGATKLLRYNQQENKWIVVGDISESSHLPIKGTGYYALAKVNKGAFVEGLVLIDASNAVSFQKILWSSREISNKKYSTESGKWIACLPKEEDINIQFLSPCDTDISSINIETIGTDVSGENLILDNAENIITIDNIVFDCDGNMVEQSGINIDNETTNNQYVFSSNTPRNISICSESSLSAIDLESGSQGPSFDPAIVPDILSNCDDLVDGFSYLKIRNDEQIYDLFAIEQIDNAYRIVSQNGEIEMLLKGNELVGDFNEQQINISIKDEGFGENGYAINCLNSPLGCGITQFEIRELDSEKIIVSMAGTLWMQTINPAVAGNFPIEGQFVISL